MVHGTAQASAQASLARFRTTIPTDLARRQGAFRPSLHPFRSVQEGRLAGHHRRQGRLHHRFPRQALSRWHRRPVVHVDRLRRGGDGRSRRRPDPAPQLLFRLRRHHQPAGGGAGDQAGQLGARRSQPRVLYLLRLGRERYGGAADPLLQCTARQAGEAAPHFAHRLLSRQHLSRHVADGPRKRSLAALPLRDGFHPSRLLPLRLSPAGRHERSSNSATIWWTSWSARSWRSGRRMSRRFSPSRSWAPAA